MRRILVAVPVVLGLTLVSALSGLLRTRPSFAAPAAEQVLRYVAPGGDDTGNDCTVQADPCASIQHAIDQSDGGDQILLAAGVYTENVFNDKTLAITGVDKASTFMDGGNLDRVIENSGSLSLADLTIRDGHLSGVFLNGGGIFNTGVITLTDVDITDNHSEYLGGGVYSTGTIFGLRVNIVNNTGGAGGAIANRGEAMFYDSSMSYNSAEFTHTSAEGGGAIYNAETGSMQISNTLVLSNTTISSRGVGIDNENVMEIHDSEISWNTGFGFASFGAIYSRGPLTISSSYIMHNAATRNAGIINSGSWLTVTHSVVGFNTAIEEGGAGVTGASGHTTIINSAIISNTFTGDGGGVHHGYGWLTIVNTEISGNQAGGIHADSTRAVLTNTTVIHNGEYGLRGGVYTMTNSIIAGSAGDNCYATTITSHGGNLEDDDTCGLTGAGDYEDIDPLIGDLDTSGPVWFHDFQIGSPAVDQGIASSCPAGDIRGLTRPVDGDLDGSAHCDIGALEYLPPLISISGPTWGAIDTPYPFTGLGSYLGLTPPVTYTWESTGHPLLVHVGGLSDTVTFTWPTPGTSWITLTVQDSLSVIATDTHQVDLGHLLFVPAVLKPHVPNAGFWDTTPGFMYVTEDHANVDEFSIYVFGVGTCGVVRIYTTSLIPIDDNAFAFNGSDIYIGSGTFDTAETAHGMVELNNLYISQCGASVTVPPTAWTGTNPLDRPAAASGSSWPDGEPGAIEFKVEVLDK